MARHRTLLTASTIIALTGFSVAAQAVPAIGLQGGTQLFSFDTATPSAASAPVLITGIGVGEQVLGIDFRPATSVLYGLGSSGSLYTINARTGIATFASTLSTGLSGGSFDISFNPTVDRLRVVSNTGQNLRINVDTGAVTVDTTLAYANSDPNTGATPSVVGAAYTNQVAGATTTTLYDIDSARNTLTTQLPPNNGTLNTVASLSPTGFVGFDIDPNGNVGYAATSSTLYQINLVSGATTSLGTFSLPNVSDFAVASVPEPMSLAVLGLGLAGIAAIRRGRSASLPG